MATEFRRVSSSLLVFGLVAAVTGHAVAVVDGCCPQVRTNKIKLLPSLISSAGERCFKTNMPSMLLVLAADVPLLSAIIDGPSSSNLVVMAIAGASPREKTLDINVVSMMKLQNLKDDYYCAIMLPEAFAAAVLLSSSFPSVATAAMPYPSSFASAIQAEACEWAPPVLTWRRGGCFFVVACPPCRWYTHLCLYCCFYKLEPLIFSTTSKLEDERQATTLHGQNSSLFFSYMVWFAACWLHLVQVSFRRRHHLWLCKARPPSTGLHRPLLCSDAALLQYRWSSKMLFLQGVGSPFLPQLRVARPFRTGVLQVLSNLGRQPSFSLSLVLSSSSVLRICNLLITFPEGVLVSLLSLN